MLKLIDFHSVNPFSQDLSTGLRHLLCSLITIYYDIVPTFILSTIVIISELEIKYVGIKSRLAKDLVSP